MSDLYKDLVEKLKEPDQESQGATNLGPSGGLRNTAERQRLAAERRQAEAAALPEGQSNKGKGATPKKQRSPTYKTKPRTPVSPKASPSLRKSRTPVSSLTKPKPEPTTVPIPAPPAQPNPVLPDPSPQNPDPNPSIPVEHPFGMAALVTQTARFCGTVSVSHPDKAALEEYDVSKWLADAETRIAARRITTEAEKIEEARLLVSSDHGNARSLLNGDLFRDVKTFKDFKAECLLIWQGLRRVDAFANLHQFMSTPRDPNLFNAASTISGNLTQIKEDLMSSQVADIDTINGESWVNLNQILQYFGLGVLYQICTEEERRAMKKVNPSPKERITQTIHQVLKEMQKSNVRLQDTVMVTRGFKPQGKGKYKKGHTAEEGGNCQTMTDRDRKPTQPSQGAKPKMTEGFRNRPKCARCDRWGHWKEQCKADQWCTICERRYHTSEECWWAIKKKKKDSSTLSASKVKPGEPSKVKPGESSAQ